MRLFKVTTHILLISFIIPTITHSKDFTQTALRIADWGDKMTVKAKYCTPKIRNIVIPKECQSLLTSEKHFKVIDSTIKLMRSEEYRLWVKTHQNEHQILSNSIDETNAAMQTLAVEYQKGRGLYKPPFEKIAYRTPTVGDKGKYYLLEKDSLGDNSYLVLSNRIGQYDQYTNFTRLEINCSTEQYLILAESEEEGAKDKPSQALTNKSSWAKWTSVIAGSSKDDLVMTVCGRPKRSIPKTEPIATSKTFPESNGSMTEAKYKEALETCSLVVEAERMGIAPPKTCYQCYWIAQAASVHMQSRDGRFFAKQLMTKFEKYKNY